MATALSWPSRTEGSGTFCVTMYNVQSSRNRGLKNALWATNSLNVDWGVLQETKLTGGIYTRNSKGYNVLATDVYCDLFEVKEQKIRGPNVLTFETVTEKDRYFDVGAYIPPTDLTTLAGVEST